MDKMRNFEEKRFCKIIITPLLRPRPDLSECVTSMIFQEVLDTGTILLGGLGGRGFQKIFFSKTSW